MPQHLLDNENIAGVIVEALRKLLRRLCVARCPLSPAASKAAFKTSWAFLRDIRFLPCPFRDGKIGRFALAAPYCSRCQAISFTIACLPSLLTGTALEISSPLTMLLSKSRFDTARLFCHTSPIVRLKSSEMRPPVETPR